MRALNRWMLRGGALRDRAPGRSPRVTTMELFFDLVYVFAVTQLSHHLLDHLTWRGALQTLVLFLGVWWAWNYTAWATNWIDPDHQPVRLLMLALMLLSLIMSAAIPDAFGERALGFALAYVLLQLLRSAFMVVALAGQRMGRNYAQLLAWSGIAGIAWLAGAFADGDARLALWIVAIALDYGAPLHGFALPGLPGTPLADWTLAGGHLAERNQLVVIVALGESMLAVGATFSEIDWTTRVAAAFAIGFVITVSLWWTYFVRYGEASTEAIERANNPAEMGRSGYAYAHGIMVAAIIVVAVAIDLTIAHPAGHTRWATAATILGGPALYLLGNAIFNWALSCVWPWSRVAGIGVLALLVPIATHLSPVSLSGLVAALLVVLSLATGSPRLPSVAEHAPSEGG